MLYPKIWDLKWAKSSGIESQLSSTKKLGFQPKSFNRRPNPKIGGQDQAQRCTRHLSMIPTNKSEPKHLRIEGTRCAWKSDENSSKKTRRSYELQEGNQRNHECFHTFGGQILYKMLKKVYTYRAWKWEGVQKDSMPRSPRVNIYMSPSGLSKWPSYPRLEMSASHQSDRCLKN
jgi:hypothetical protein